MTASIHSRILSSAFIILVLFMGLTGAILDRAFRNNIDNSQRENLRIQIYTLLATANLDSNNKLQLPDEMTEPRLNLTESSLHAQVLTPDKKIIWQSRSMLNTTLPLPSGLKTGEFSFSDYRNKSSTFTMLNFSTAWITNQGEQAYIFQIAENKNVLNSQLNIFQKNLWGWLAGVSLFLIIIQVLILRWGLKPLRHVADDLLNIEKGKEKNLSGNYPKEIDPLAKNLNKLLDSSSQQLARYRDGLGNMAHSLKTPVAVLQGIIENATITQKDIAIEQLKTINNIVDYQLQRASTAGRSQLGHVIPLLPITNKIISTLNKVYQHKQIQSEININSSLNINIDEGDLYELLGNLLENAYKWCNKKVTVSAKVTGNKVQLTIEDDGSGINEEARKRILLRGQRADQNTPGQGLGLAIVTDILVLYKGNMEISKSATGGAKITIEL